jgi:hypothetical protein
MLELITADEFPGSQRYIGLGQLPSEALRLLWLSRKPVTPAQLALGDEAWNALASDDPRPSPRSLWHAGTADHGSSIAPASTRVAFSGKRAEPHGALVLQILSESGTFTSNRMWQLLQTEREPLPCIGDLGPIQVI